MPASKPPGSPGRILSIFSRRAMGLPALVATVILSLPSAANAQTVQFEETEGTAREGRRFLTDVELSLPSGALTSALTVTYQVSTSSGTAEDADIAAAALAQAGTVEFPVGSVDGATQRIRIQIVDDDLFEDDETFTVTLSNPTGGLAGGVQLGSATTATGTITDETEAVVSIQMTPNRSFNAAKGDTFEFDVTLETPTGGDLRTEAAIEVTWMTEQDSGPGAAVAGRDFTAVAAGTITLGPTEDGETATSGQISVETLVAAEVAEGDKTFTVSLAEPSHPRVALKTGEGSVQATIRDSTFIGFEADPGPGAGEGTEGDSLVFVVEYFPRAVAVDVTVAYTIEGTGMNRAGAADFGGASMLTGTVVIPAGETRVDLSIPTVQDNEAEGDETFTVTLAEPVGGFSSPFAFLDHRNFLVASGTIMDDDDATLSALSLSAGTLNPAFVSGTASYTSLVDSSVTSLTVTPTAADADHTSITVNGNAVTSGMASGAISLSVGANPITIVVTAEDTSTTMTYTVTVTRAASGAPIVISSGAYPVAENSAVDIDVGAALTTSNFPGSGGSWSITAGNTGNVFKISSGGQIQVAAATLDHETTPSYTLTVQFAQGGATATAMVSVSVTDVNEAPMAVGTIDPVMVTVGARQLRLDVRGYFSDPEGDVLTYTATSTSNAALVVFEPPESGVAIIAPSFESSLTATITVTDPGGLMATQDLSITVNPRDTPTVTATGAYVVREDAANDTDVGAELRATGFTGSGGSWSITTGNTGAAFAIDDTGQISTAAALDFETTPSYTLTVQFAQNGMSATTSVIVTVSDVNDAPTAVGTIDAVVVAAGADAVMREVSNGFDDPDAGDTLTYTAVSSHPNIATVSVSGSTLSITPVAAGSATVTVTAMDIGGQTATQEFSVTVNPANTPTVTASGTYSVREDAVIGTDVGAALVMTGFTGSGGTWSITAGNFGAEFAIDDTGQITTAASLDHETIDHYDLTVQFAQNGMSATADIVIAVTDVNEAPIVVRTFNPVMAPVDAFASTLPVSGSFEDPDDGDTLTYTAESSHTNIATVSVSGSTVSITPVAVGSATVTITATDSDGLTATQDIAVTITVETSVAPPGGSTPGGVVVLDAIDVIAGFVLCREIDGAQGSLTAISTNDSVATVTASGSTLHITGLEPGTAWIYPRDARGLGDGFRVRVVDGPALPQRAGVTIQDTPTTATFSGGVSLDRGLSYAEGGRIAVDDEIQMVFTIRPAAEHVGAEANLLVVAQDPATGALGAINNQGRIAPVTAAELLGGEQAFARRTLTDKEILNVLGGKFTVEPVHRGLEVNLYVGYSLQGAPEVIWFNPAPFPIAVD